MKTNPNCKFLVHIDVNLPAAMQIFEMLPKRRTSVVIKKLSFPGESTKFVFF
jgi:hypothetical protein